MRLMATIQNVLFNQLDFHMIRDELFCTYSTDSCVVQIFDMIRVGLVKYHVRLFNIYSSSRTVWTLMCIYSDAVVSFTVIQLHVILQLARSYKNTNKIFCIGYLINVQAVQAKCFARVYILYINIYMKSRICIRQNK